MKIGDTLILIFFAAAFGWVVADGSYQKSKLRIIAADVQSIKSILSRMEKQ